MATINNNKLCWLGCGGKEDFYTIGGMQISATAVESSVEVPQKTKNRDTI
jgi:hypothetical protein